MLVPTNPSLVSSDTAPHYSNLTHYNLTADEYDTYDFPEPWTDVDLSYPTEYDLEDDIAFLEEEDYEEEEKAEELEMLKKKEEVVSMGEEVEELEDGSGLLSLYDDDEAMLGEQEYFSAMERLQEDDSKHNSNLVHDSRIDQEVEVEELGGWEACTNSMTKEKFSLVISSVMSMLDFHHSRNF